MSFNIFKIIEEVEVENISFESFCDIVEVEESATFESIANEGILSMFSRDPNKVITADMKNGLKAGVKIEYTKGQKLKNKAVFKKVELAYGVELPADLKKFIELYNGCDIISGENRYEMLSFNEDSQGQSVLYDSTVSIFKDKKINFIPLINDGFGNYYGVTNDSKIGLYNHENDEIKEIADTWSNFLTTKNL